MFHVELRQFPHVARAFNLSEEELRARVLDAWARGELVELGERQWAPERAQLKVYEGPRLREDEIGMGRGWPNATRAGSDVTDSLVIAPRRHTPPAIPPELSDFKREVLRQTAAGRIGVHQVMWLANARHPQRRVSERIALAEQSVWELLHERRLTMVQPGPADGELEPVVHGAWEQSLLAWSSWAGSPGPILLLERVFETR